MVVGKCQLGALHLPNFRPQESRGEADQARLATAVASRQMQRLARPEFQIEALEQQPPAAPQRYILEPEQRPHSAASSSACMSSSENPKWWPISWITTCATSRSRLSRLDDHSARIGRRYKVIRSGRVPD